MQVIVKGLIPPKGEYHVFNSITDKIEFLKSVDLLSKTSEDIKQFFYKGLYAEQYCICEVVGYESKSTLVISIDNHLHCINTEHFKDIQPLVKEVEKHIDNIPCYCEE